MAASLVAAAPSLALADPVSDGPDSVVFPGAAPGPATATVPIWHDVFTDPTNGVAYGVDLVGSEDPRTPGAATTTIPTEIIPVNLSFDANGGEQFNGSDVTAATLSSPIFQGADYSAFSNNVGVQYGDAVMRSEFNQVGASPFHLQLAPSALPTLTLAVPPDRGYVKVTPLGVRVGCVDLLWFYRHMWATVSALHVSPTTLPIFNLRDTYMGAMVDGVCHNRAVGFHGAGNPGLGKGSVSSEKVGQTVIETAYFTTPPAAATPTHPYSFRDIDVLAHEVAEWENDPFGLNVVQPYKQPNAASYGACSNIFETGDPVPRYQTHLPGNTFFQSEPGNNATWTVQDEVFLPWFARESPNLTSEPDSSGFGRYTFFGDLNPTLTFQSPAVAC